MVPRVKLAYDKVSDIGHLMSRIYSDQSFGRSKRVFDIIHPSRRNLTAIRGYVRMGGLPDDPHTDPQDRTWYGPHDRLFVDEESEAMEFHTGPEYGAELFDLPSLCQLTAVGLQCGAGVGTEPETLTDRTLILYGSICPTNLTRQRLSWFDMIGASSFDLELPADSEFLQGYRAFGQLQ